MNNRDTGRRPRLLPAFPFKRWLPVVLAAASVVVLVIGLLSSDGAMTALGALGLAATVFAFFLAPLLIGRDGDGDDPP
ncbi:MAG: hypothetical protein HY875_11920 [Chloroflexi bacterium]|nr:hypothetical protein [Chloroflexota bacterium]